MKPVAMVGWSGAGRFEDMKTTALHKIGASAEDAARVADALVLSSADPVATASKLAFLPGVAWIAVGYRFARFDGYLAALRPLAKRYLSRGKSFRISAQSTRSKQTAGDLVLAGNSELISEVKGAKVNERNPRARFRVSLDGSNGACGAELRAGPGGIPTSSEVVSCLVSGGERSSVMAWSAALSGYSLRLVHSWTDDAALRCVGRLYSELSFRMDPRGLHMVVLKGEGSAIGRLGGWLESQKGPAFAGLRPRRLDDMAALAARFPNLSFPLVLTQADYIGAAYRSLGIGRPAAGSEAGFTLRALEASTRFTEATFGGAQADSNTVIDAIKRQP